MIYTFRYPQKMILILNLGPPYKVQACPECKNTDLSWVEMDYCYCNQHGKYEKGWMAEDLIWIEVNE